MQSAGGDVRSAVEPVVEPGAGPAQDVGLVVAFPDGVALSRVDHELVFDAEVTQCSAEVYGLSEGDVGVLGAVRDEHRGCRSRCAVSQHETTSPALTDQDLGLRPFITHLTR
jgi:hypothetical protein